jgi:hypothetical protein
MECSTAMPFGWEWWQEKRKATISVEVVTQSFEMLDKILQHSEADALDLVNLYARSCKAYEDHDYSLCLATAWTVIEKLLYYFWEGYLNHLNGTRQPAPGRAKFINSKRKDNLIKGQNYSASIVIEILSLTNTIPASLYEELMVLRKARNNWIHELKAPEWETAKDAVLKAAEMLRLIYNLDLNVPLGSSILL